MKPSFVFSINSKNMEWFSLARLSGTDVRVCFVGLSGGANRPGVSREVPELSYGALMIKLPIASKSANEPYVALRSLNTHSNSPRKLEGAVEEE